MIEISAALMAAAAASAELIVKFRDLMSAETQAEADSIVAELRAQANLMHLVVQSELRAS